MKLRINILLACALNLAFVVNLAHAGVGLNRLSSVIKFVPFKEKWDVAKAVVVTQKVSSSSLFIQRELFAWHLHQLQKGIRDPQRVGQEFLLLEEITKMYSDRARIVEWVLTSHAPVATFDKYVGRFNQDDEMLELRANLVMYEAKKKAGEKAQAEQKEIERIAKIIRDAKAASQEYLTKEERDKILAMAQAALFNEAQRLIMVARHRVQSSSSSPVGASVFSSSTVIKQ